MAKFIDIKGQRFGKLTVIERIGKDKFGNGLWHCKCDCGNETNVILQSLKDGKTKSCGCYAREQKTNFVHGLKNTRIYKCWTDMKARCYRPTTTHYSYYGGRGITVCEEWKNNFKCFYDWAMDNGYTDDLTLDRIDSNGNYEPSNCRWANKITQANNTRRNHFISYKGETRTIAQWADYLGISKMSLYERIHRGVDEIQALETPVKSAPKVLYLTYMGETKSIKEWGEIYNLKSDTIAHRINRGWSVENALTKPLDIRRKNYGKLNN